MTCEKRLQEVVNFWRRMFEEWNAGLFIGQSFLDSFQQLYKLRRVRDLLLLANTDNALRSMFEGGNDFESQIVSFNGNRSHHTSHMEKEYEVRFRWKRHPSWIHGHGRSLMHAYNSAARHAFIAIMGHKGMHDLDEISSSGNYLGIGANKLASELYNAVGSKLFYSKSTNTSGVGTGSTHNSTSSLPDPRLKNTTSVLPPTVKTFRSSAPETFDVRNLTQEIYQKKSIVEREGIIANFWASRIQTPENFPILSNLISTKCISKNGMRCFQLLFSAQPDKRRKQVQFEVVNQSSSSNVKVCCTWLQGGKTVKNIGYGKDFNVAANQAGKEAMELVLGSIEFARIDHMSQPFIWKSIKNDRINQLLQEKCGNFREAPPLKSPVSRNLPGLAENQFRSSAVSQPQQLRIVPPGSALVNSNVCLNRDRRDTPSASSSVQFSPAVTSETPMVERYSTQKIASIEDSQKSRDPVLESTNKPRGLTKGKSATSTPFLPFHELLGMVFPDEAPLGLETLFSGRDEDGPRFESKRCVIAECRFGSGLCFRAIGSTQEEAQNNAARQALAYMRSKEVHT